MKPVLYDQKSACKILRLQIVAKPVIAEFPTDTMRFAGIGLSQGKRI
jgi:hypothetical protein